MSFAMDDLNRSYGVDPALQTRLIEENRSTEKPVESKTSDSRKKEPEVNDVFETTQQKRDLIKTIFEKAQEDSTVIDIKKETLEKIASYVKDIKTTIESENSEAVSRKKIDENYEKINQIAKETSFNNTKLIQTSENDISKEKEAVSFNEMKISDIKNLEITTPEQKKESVEKLNDIINNIKNKEQDLSAKKEELTQSVNKNSLVELKIPSSPEIEVEIKKEEEVVSSEGLKETAIKNIIESPKKNIEMHIQNLDKNLLLAMLSLRSA